MTVNDLLKLPGIEALGRAEAVWVGQQYSPISFNWLLLAEAAASQVHHVPIDLSGSELSGKLGHATTGGLPPVRELTTGAHRPRYRNPLSLVGRTSGLLVRLGRSTIASSARRHKHHYR